MSQKVGIVTECVCDLPDDILHKYDIRVIYFQIKTKHGSFRDTVEISAGNIFEYILKQGHVPISKVPEAEEYAQLYKEMLGSYDEVVHICISSKVSASYDAAMRAVRNMGDMGEKIHVFDSEHLSTGQGYLILKAAEMAAAGASASEILQILVSMKSKISTSFIVENVDFLYFNGRLSDKVKRICDRFGLHPILAMKKGELVLDGILVGDYDSAAKKYIKRQLKKSKDIETGRIFLTHAGCSLKMLEEIKKEMEKYCRPKGLIITEASATVSSNCGPNAFGVLFCKK